MPLNLAFSDITPKEGMAPNALRAYCLPALQIAAWKTHNTET